MIPIRQGDGTGLIPNGYAEVRKGDGTVLWSGKSSTTIIEDVERPNPISDYSGDTADYELETTDVLQGDVSLTADPELISGFDKIYTTTPPVDELPQKGGTFSQLVDLQNSNTVFRVMFGGPDQDNAYFGSLNIRNGVVDIQRLDSGSETTLNSTSVSIPTGVYEMVFDWQSDDTITLTVYNTTGSNYERDTELASVSTTDSTYNSAGFGYFIGGDQPVEVVWDWGIIDPSTSTSTTEYFASDGMSLPVTGHNMQPQAVYDSTSNKTFVVWQGGGLDPQAAEYDHASGSWSTPVQIGTSPLSNDDHGVPVLTIDSGGYLWAAFGSHSPAGGTSDQPLTKSDNPRDATSWTEQTAIGGWPDNGPTYPSFFESGGTQHLVCRRRVQGSDHPDGERLVMSHRQSGDDLSTWSSTTDLVDFGNNSRIYPYSKVQNGSDLQIGFTYTDTSSGSSWYNLYHMILDLTDLSVTAIDGTPLSTPIDKTTADNNALVVDSESDGDQLVTSEVHLDGNNNPHFTFCRESGGTTYHYYTYWTGSSWATPTQITQSGGLDSYQDFFINSTSDITAYFTIDSGDRSGDIEKWQYDGSSWTLESTVYDEANYSEGAIAGQRVLNGLDSFDLFFSQVDKDDYSNNDLKVYGYRTDTDSFVGREQ